MMSDPHISSYRPDLPDWGVYLRWPVAGEAWIHSDDREIAAQLLPSPRVLRRVHWDGQYYHLRYGTLQLRVQPSMWLSVPAVDLEVGQQVELLSRANHNDPGIYRIADILYSVQSQSIDYYLYGDSLKLEKRFSRADLCPLQVKHYLRVGYYQHRPPTADIPDDVELLNVGELTS